MHLFIYVCFVSTYFNNYLLFVLPVRSWDIVYYCLLYNITYYIIANSIRKAKKNKKQTWYSLFLLYHMDNTLTSSISSVLDSYFTPETMSVHIKSDNVIASKVGKPWEWKMVMSKKPISQEEVNQLIDIIMTEVANRKDAFLEIERKLSKVIQLGLYRIVIVYPPLSNSTELTVVRPVKRLSLQDYHLDEKVIELITKKAKGILIAGAPGSGKTTFAQGLIDVYAEMKKIIKTIESPRDLIVPKEVTQYSFNHGTHDEVRDILLLSRPDYAIYDEVRNISDFLLYKDLRLTGIGLVGVIHATAPIDSIQRFVGHIELGIVPQVIDTVLFIAWWKLEQICTLSLTVKLPTGMASADLARPVIEIKDFLTDKLMYELYTFGEQVVVIPVADLPQSSAAWWSPTQKLAQQYITDYLDKKLPFDHVIRMAQDSLTLYIPDEHKGSVIGKGGDNINRLQQNLGVSISVKSFDELPIDPTHVDIEMHHKSKATTLKFTPEYAGKKVLLLVGDTIAKVSVLADASVYVTDRFLVRLLSTYGAKVVSE